MSKVEALRQQLQAERAKEKKVEVSGEPPTYPIEHMVPVEEARADLKRLLKEFLREAAAWHDQEERSAELREQGRHAPATLAPVWVIQITVGGGKSTGAAEVFSEDRRQLRAAGDDGPMASLPFYYVLPTHRVNREIAGHFIGHGLDAHIYRGREQPDPDDETVLMCLQSERTKDARAAGASVTRSCCKRKKLECSDLKNCGYWRQFDFDQQADVWLAATNMLYHPQHGLKEIAALIIDESFWQQGVRGFTSEWHRIDDLLAAGTRWPGFGIEERDERLLLEAIKSQEADGGLVLADLPEELTAEHCTEMYKAEWKFINDETKKLEPTANELMLAAFKKKLPVLRHARFMAGLYNAVREMRGEKSVRGRIEPVERIEVSGRITLRTDKDTGDRLVRLTGVRDVHLKWRVPTLILDATAPDLEILKVWFDPVQIEFKAKIDIAAPYQHVRQIIGAPVSKARLFGTEKHPKTDRNLHAIRHKILELFLETDRKPMLVICQEKVELWLKEQWLPPGIALEHHNNFRGLDKHKDVAHLVVVGRTAPGPWTDEAYAGAMSGHEPIKVPENEHWYGKEGRVDRYIGLAGGGTVRVKGDRHPDPLGEAIRWQINEAGIVQAIGRARGVLRTAENPLQVTILGDVCLPLLVDEVETWRAPSSMVEMWAAGLAVLGSAADMVRIWPKNWPKLRTAERAVQALFGRRGGADRHISKNKLLLREVAVCSEGEPAPPDWLPFTYQHRASGAKHIPAMFDPAIVPFPRELLEAELGQLGSLFHLVEQPKIGDFGGKGGLQVDMALIKATTVHETMPIELRFQALGLPLPRRWPSQQKRPLDAAEMERLREKAEMWTW